MATEVKILGKTYAFRSECDERFTNETANFVNGKLKELMNKIGPITSEKAAILAAMNFAGELLQIQRQQKARDDLLRRKAKKLLEMIDSYMEDD